MWPPNGQEEREIVQQQQLDYEFQFFLPFPLSHFFVLCVLHCTVPFLPLLVHISLPFFIQNKTLL